MAFLFDILLQEFGKRAIAKVTVPNHITDNLRGCVKINKLTLIRRGEPLLKREGLFKS